MVTYELERIRDAEILIDWNASFWAVNLYDELGREIIQFKKDRPVVLYDADLRGGTVFWKGGDEFLYGTSPDDVAGRYLAEHLD